MSGGEWFGTDCVVIPDLPEPILAYRAWTLRDDYLAGFGGVVWPKDKVLVAECYGDILGLYQARLHAWSMSLSFGLSGRDRDPMPRKPSPCVESPCADPADHPGHGCGIYGYDTVDQMAAHATFSDDEVWGQVELGGTVYEHAHGYRASHGRVVAIYRVPNAAVARRASEAYDVPLIDFPLTQPEVDALRRPDPEPSVLQVKQDILDRSKGIEAASDPTPIMDAPIASLWSRRPGWLCTPIDKVHPLRRFLLNVGVYIATVTAAVKLPGTQWWPIPVYLVTSRQAARSVIAGLKNRGERRRG